MPMDRTERLSGIVEAFSEYIDVVQAYDLADTAALLRMVKLDLQTHIHDISDEELKALCEAVEEHQAAVPAVAGHSGGGPEHTHASLVLPSSSVSDRILLGAPRSPRRYRRM